MITIIDIMVIQQAMVKWLSWFLHRHRLEGNLEAALQMVVLQNHDKIDTSVMGLNSRNQLQSLKHFIRFLYQQER